MRFEAKHQYFKRLATSMGNYINLAHSLAYRHQCYVLQDDDVLHDKVECGPGNTHISCLHINLCICTSIYECISVFILL